MTRVVYLADIRLPTEKAHGWQIVKMCEAFAATGADVELWHPRRHQDDPRLRGRSVHDFYGVPPSFRVRTLRGPDVVSMEPRLPGPISRTLIQGYSALWEAVVANGPRADLLYTRDLGVAAWAALRRIPAAYEVHQIGGPRTRSAIRWMARRRQPRIVALTPYIRSAFRKAGFADQRIVVEGDAVDPRQYEGLPSRYDARVALGLPTDRPLVGYVGRFHMFDREKGLPELVRAMAHVPAIEGEEPLLVCIGGPMDVVPSYLEQARAAGVHAERLRFLDRVPNTEVPRWLRALDVGVMPYPDNEHFSLASSPLKMFEYMAAGTPLVATDLPSARLVLRDGESARLVAPGDPAAMGAGITELLEDPALAEAMAAQALQDVQDVTWEARARRILAFAVPKVGG